MSADAFTPAASSRQSLTPERSEPVVRVRRRPLRTRVGRPVYNTIAVAVAVVWIFPIYWMLLVALTPLGQVYSLTPQFLPTDMTFSAFSTVLHDPVFWQSLRNSLIVVGCTVVIAIIVGFLASVAIARFKFRGRNAVIIVAMVVQMVPLIALIVPLDFIYSKVGLSESLMGLIVGYLALTLPFSIWTLRGFVANVPVELEEAAMVDGCTRFTAFVRVILPLVVPGLISTSVYTLIQSWNEFQMANFFISDQNHWTLPLYLNSYQSTTKEVLYNEVMATSLLMAIPVVILFMLVQRQVASGLTAGAVKG